MKTDLETLKDTFKISFDTYEESIDMANEVTDMFHNRQYSQEQLAILANRGQPAETFNIIKMFARLLLGYYSTVVNAVKVSPRKPSDILTASLLNDVLTYTMEANQMETEGDKMKLDGLLAGLMCVYIDVVDTDEKDQFGRVIRKVEISHVPWKQISIDPLSTKEDYSDARYIHRWKWVSDDQLFKLFPKKKAVIQKLTEYENHLLINDTEFEESFATQFQGYFKRYNNYLLVHTVIEDNDKKRWSIFWCGDEELSREEITYKEVKFPYRVEKIHTSDQAEFYGIFREVTESQKAINQALLKIQLMVNTQKAFVQKGGVEDIDKFTAQFNRVNAIIEVLDINKIKIENLTREVLDQYTVIDKALNRIQQVLGVNDSFMGMAYASDSGRKVKLQQNATTMALRYVSIRIEQFYRLLAWDVINLVKQYYTATQALLITDDIVGERWVELNKPMQMWTGQFDENKQPIMDMVWEEVLDPASGKPMLDEDGNVIVAPIPSAETEIAFTDVNVTLDSVVYNDEDEKNQLMIETILQGNIGSMMSQANPAGFFQAASLAVKGMKMKNSITIAELLEQTAQLISGGAVPPPNPASARDQPKSQALKLPQNTNEAG